MQFEDTSKSYFNRDNGEAVCPYCGYVHHDSWELDDEDKIFCNNCEKEFFVCREIVATYSTHRINEDGSVDYRDTLIKAEQEDK